MDGECYLIARQHSRLEGQVHNLEVRQASGVVCSSATLNWVQPQGRWRAGLNQCHVLGEARDKDVGKECF